MRIALLHSIETNPAVFDRVAGTFGLPALALRHEIRVDLREAMQREGGQALRARIQACLRSLAAQADAVIVTCAMLGAAVDDTAAMGVPIVRADKSLAQAAMAQGGDVTVICAAASAVDATRRLFAAHAPAAGSTVTVRHIPEIWDLYLQGDVPAALARTALAADAAYESGADVVAFAHPWMADAARPAADGRRPLDSAHAALRTALSGGGK